MTERSSRLCLWIHNKLHIQQKGLQSYNVRTNVLNLKEKLALIYRTGILYHACWNIATITCMSYDPKVLQYVYVLACINLAITILTACTILSPFRDTTHFRWSGGDVSTNLSCLCGLSLPHSGSGNLLAHSCKTHCSQHKKYWWLWYTVYTIM